MFYNFPYILRISDINYGGHMGNDAVLTICHDARLAFLKSIGQSELNLFGGSLIQADAGIIYKNEAFHGDNINVEVYLESTSSSGFDMYYKLLHSDGRPIAFAKTGIVFFDYELRKVRRTPKEFLDYLSSIE